jgi:3-dehydroquinate synthetase
VASVLFRGIPCAQAPTTLLAMVDSSVGGKTGVNLPSGKNLVGTFHQPLLVFADLSTLATLSPRDLSSGLGELAKHALLDGGNLLERLEAGAEAAARGDGQTLAPLVAESCAYKARVVAADEREQSPSGGRALLNLGHTVGHALETHSHREGEPLRHGEAVGLGLLAAARVGQATGPDAEPGLEARIASLLARLGLPTDLDARLSREALAPIAVDKKRAGARVRYVSLPRRGAARMVAIEPARLTDLLLSSRTRPNNGNNGVTPEVGK